MSFMLMIMEPPGARQGRSLEQGKVAFEQMMGFQKRLQDQGILIASEALKSDDHAARIEIRGGKRNVSDGPFTESKEIIGGFFLLDVKTREQAMEIALSCPACEWGMVELREIANSCYE
ncbi:YciI family protein [Myxococcus sp. K15C18031901]|uniref:YciI family protein n=1 Tax=Myxococcus dinghuensis TaxID=2906761 RepID=UPI0020A832F3|nr:YciI family protein [Myxococcus dinghuensis]MCP3097387.1 YciI family protein [Myxococcus dinghuensis]